MKRAADILARLLEESADDQTRGSSGVFRSWADIAGRPLADHSRVYELQHGQLCVEVDHPGWLQVLLLRKNQIMQGVARAYPQLKVRGLRARVNPRYGEGPQVGTKGAPKGPAHATPPAPAPAQPAADEVEQAVSAAGSEDLRARLRRLFAASLRRSRPGPRPPSSPGPDRG